MAVQINELVIRAEIDKKQKETENSHEDSINSRTVSTEKELISNKDRRER